MTRTEAQLVGACICVFLFSCDAQPDPSALVTTYKHPEIGFSLRLPEGWEAKTNPEKGIAFQGKSRRLMANLLVVAAKNPNPNLRPGMPEWIEWKDKLRKMHEKDLTTVELMEECTSGGFPALQVIASASNPNTGTRLFSLTHVIVKYQDMFSLSFSGPDLRRDTLLPSFRAIANSFEVPP